MLSFDAMRWDATDSYQGLEYDDLWKEQHASPGNVVRYTQIMVFLSPLVSFGLMLNVRAQLYR